MAKNNTLQQLIKHLYNNGYAPLSAIPDTNSEMPPMWERIYMRQPGNLTLEQPRILTRIGFNTDYINNGEFMWGMSVFGMMDNIKVPPSRRHDILETLEVTTDDYCLILYGLAHHPTTLSASDIRRYLRTGLDGILTQEKHDDSSPAENHIELNHKLNYYLTTAARDDNSDVFTIHRAWHNLGVTVATLWSNKLDEVITSIDAFEDNHVTSYYQWTETMWPVVDRVDELSRNE